VLRSDFCEAREHIRQFASQLLLIEGLAVGVMIQQQLRDLAAFFGESRALPQGWVIKASQRTTQPTHCGIDGTGLGHVHFLKRTSWLGLKLT
jgi:hypothetical protein